MIAPNLMYPFIILPVFFSMIIKWLLIKVFSRLVIVLLRRWKAFVIPAQDVTLANLTGYIRAAGKLWKILLFRFDLMKGGKNTKDLARKKSSGYKKVLAVTFSEY